MKMNEYGDMMLGGSEPMRIRLLFGIDERFIEP